MRKILIISLLIIMSVLLILSGCGQEDTPTTTPDITLTFIGENTTIHVGDEYTLPLKFFIDDSAGDISKLTFTISTPDIISINGNKISAIAPGEVIISVSYGEIKDEFKVKVLANDSKEKTIEEIVSDLLNDGYMTTTYTNTPDTPVYAEEYELLKVKKLPLEEGEKYIETFDSDYYHSRLYPEQVINGATTSVKDNIEGMDGNCLSIMTDGSANGNYDAVVFKGFKIVPGATYRISITAKTMNDGRNYYVGFRSLTGDNYAFNFSGTSGELVKKTNTITVGGYDYTGLVIVIAGGDSAELIIDNLTVERLGDIEEVDLTTIGSQIYLDFEESDEYVSPNQSVLTFVTGNEAINGRSIKVQKIGSWQGIDFTNMKFEPNGLYKVSLKTKLLSGSSGMAFATFSSAGNGSYQDVSNQLTIINSVVSFSGVFRLKNYSDYFFNISLSDPSCVFVVDEVKIECISEESLKFKDLTSIGDQYFENFDDAILTEEGLPHIVSASSIISLQDEENGKSLKIEKKNSWAGLNTKDIVLKALGTYRVSFKMKLIKGSTEHMYATFSSAGNGSYQDVANLIVPKQEWTSFEFIYKLKDYNDYYFNFSFYDASAIVLLDDLLIECVSPDTVIETPTEEGDPIDLTKQGSKFEENFNNISDSTFAYYFAAAGSASISIDNSKLKVEKSGSWKGLSIKNISFASGATYKFTFKLNVTKMNTTEYFELIFADETIDKVAQNLASFVTMGNETEVSFEITLFADANNLTIGCYSSDAIYTIDDLVIECIKTKNSSASYNYPTIDLTRVGNKLEENFDNIEDSKVEYYYTSTGSARIAASDGKLKVTKINTWQGLKLKNMTFAGGATYRISFKLNVSKINTTDYFELIFADETADKVAQNLASFVTIGSETTVSFEITPKTDASELLIGCYSGDAIYTIDDLIIECIAK